MKKILEIYQKNKEIINYVIVGGCTTIVSLVTYYILSNILDIENDFYFTLANILSWIITVTFAYIANKIFVFKTKTNEFKETLKETTKFFSARIFTLLTEIVLMYILVKIIKIDNFIAKLLMQFIILVLNYLLSKLVVFKKHN